MSRSPVGTPPVGTPPVGTPPGGTPPGGTPPVGTPPHGGPGAAVDDTGVALSRLGPVRRVVSLVPSLTEAVAATAVDLLIGATDYCSHPPGLAVTRVGGTKNPALATVRALRPDLVLANEEENRPADLAALRAAGLPVWVTAPRTVPQGLVSLHRMLAVCGLDRPAWLDAAVAAWPEPPPRPRWRAFVPVWRRPWMSLGRDTFAGDLLRRCSVGHVYADDPQRYPKVDLTDARDRAPDLVVLPDEPFRFTPDADLPAFAGWGVPVAFVSGRHLTWYGPSLVEAPAVLARALAAAVPAPPAGSAYA